ncbi:MAG: response regulator [Chloroflexota bacterium]
MTTPQALIVEDNVMNSEILETLLQQSGIASASITSPNDIQETIAQMSNIAVIFLDLEFPTSSGFHIHKTLREAEWAPSVPIIAYSVHTGDIDRANREGFDGFIGKPVDPLLFPEHLKRILAGEAVWSVS